MAPIENNFPPRGPKIVLGRRLLGADRITPTGGQVIAKVPECLDPEMPRKVLADTQTATGCVYVAQHKRMAREDSNE